MAEGKHTGELVELTEAQRKAQKSRNIAIALALIAFCILMYIGTLAKLDASFFNRDI